jgi:hypothetical protein
MGVAASAVGGGGAFTCVGGLLNAHDEEHFESTTFELVLQGPY